MILSQWSICQSLWYWGSAFYVRQTYSHLRIPLWYLQWNALYTLYFNGSLNIWGFERNHIMKTPLGKCFTSTQGYVGSNIQVNFLITLLSWDNTIVWSGDDTASLKSYLCKGSWLSSVLIHCVNGVLISKIFATPSTWETFVCLALRLLEENEHLMQQHLGRLRQVEQEKSELSSSLYSKLEDQEREKAKDIEKVKDQHRLVVWSSLGAFNFT